MTAWPDSVDEILHGDDVVMLAYATPASGAVLTPVTNFRTRDRNAATITVSSSVGAWKKLDRIKQKPEVALAFHTRENSATARPEYVLVQGTASLSPPIADYPEQRDPEEWDRVEGWSGLHPLWKRWLRVYATRVSIEIAMTRVLVWPDLGCHGDPEVHGDPLPPEHPASQRPPRKGTAPRVNHRRVAAAARRLPDTLVGWVGADPFPVMLPVAVEGASDDGILLAAPSDLLPSGGRRAGLTAHWFGLHAMGQNQRIHTGWLTVDPGSGRVVHSPHTAAAYRFPTSASIFHLVAGGGTRWRLWRAKRAGALPEWLSGTSGG